MTQKILLFNLILTFFLCFGCKNSKESTDAKADISVKKDSLKKEEIYKKIEHFISIYDTEEERKQMNLFDSMNPIPKKGDIDSIRKLSEDLIEKKRMSGYSINDSLNFYFSKLSPDSLFNDKQFIYLAGKLLEKRYLYNRKSSNSPKTFPIYNLYVSTSGVSSSNFALNIVTKMERNKNTGYKEYSRTGQEFVCIDTIVLILDKLPQMQNEANHKICMELVKKNETGGCNW